MLLSWFLKLTLVRKHFKPATVSFLSSVSNECWKFNNLVSLSSSPCLPTLPPPKRCWKYAISFPLQGEIDAHEDSFKSADESGQALLAAGHYASDEVREKVK